jgi:2-isopropylmalate synthase
VHPRHPYGGDLVFTAFSGSHQDAIKKGLAARATEMANGNPVWDVPYLPIDPADVGRTYDAVIRVNSQSGKGGITYLLESEYGLELPRRLQIEFSRVVQSVMDDAAKELTASDIWRIFEREYVIGDESRVQVSNPNIADHADGAAHLSADVWLGGRQVRIDGVGAGPIDAFVNGLAPHICTPLRVLDYHEHSMGSGADARAVAYLELRVGQGVGEGQTLFGVGIDTSIVSASLKAILSGLSRAQFETTAGGSHSAFA